MLPTRRTLLATAPALVLGACDSRAEPSVGTPALKDLAPFAVGTCVMSGQIADPAWRALADGQFDQVTPEWEMKMEAILRPDGGYDWSRPDAIAAYARVTGKRLYGHTLVWYAQTSPAFERIDGTGERFAQAYRSYISAVAGRYRGQAVAWDTVNEPVAEDGDGYRDCIWRRNLGMAYVDLAFEHAAEADPAAVRVLNDYNLESNPRKRRTFMALLEGMLARGVPVGMVGTQSHIDVDLPPGAYRTALQELASFGLPVHISELDVSFGRAPTELRGDRELALKQARVVAEVIESYLELPVAQRFALTLWGVRDADSWLRRPPNDVWQGGLRRDRPLLFDDAGMPKPAFDALAGALRRG